MLIDTTVLEATVADLTQRMTAVEAAVAALQSGKADAAIVNAALAALSTQVTALVNQVQSVSNDLDTLSTGTSTALANLSARLTTVEKIVAFLLGIYKSQVPTPVITITNNTVVDNAAVGAVAGLLNTNLAGTITWDDLDNSKFDLVQDGSVNATLVVSASGSGHFTAGTTETVTISATNGAQTVQQPVSVFVIAHVTPTQNWLNPPSLPTNKIRVHWNAPGDISIPPTMTNGVLNALSETANCWRVENVAGTVAAPFDGLTYSSLQVLMYAIGPSVGVAGIEAQVDAGYVLGASGGIYHDLPGISWFWTCVSSWDNAYPHPGGFHYRPPTQTTQHVFQLNDPLYTATVMVQDWMIGPFPCELAMACAGVVGSGATVGGLTLPVASIELPPTYSNQYVNEVYRLQFTADTTTPGLRNTSYAITANTSGGTPSISVSKAWATGTLPVAGDKFRIVACRTLGDDVFYVWRIGLLVRNHVGVYRGSSNGLAVSGYYEWDNRIKCQIHDFDCLTASCGTQTNVHNHYPHNVALYSSRRGFSHDSSGHQWKFECNACILDDCTVGGHMYVGTVLENVRGNGDNNALTDLQQHVRSYYRNLRLIPTNYTTDWNKRQFVTIQERFSNFSSHFSTLPTPIKKNLSTDPDQVYWTYGSVNNPKTIAANVYTGSANSTLILEQVGVLLDSFGNAQSLTLNTPYDVEFSYDDNSVYTGQVTMASVVSNIYTGTLNPPMTKTTSRYKPCILKLPPDNWDIPVVDVSARGYCDPGFSDYMWGAGTTNGIRDNTGKLDLSKQKGAVNGYPAQYFDGCFMTPTQLNITAAGLIQVTRDCYTGVFNRSALTLQIPLPPLKSTTGDWPDPPNAGQWTGQLQPHAPGLATNGTGGTGVGGSDFVRPNFCASRQITWYTKGLIHGLTYQYNTSNVSTSEPTGMVNIPTNVMHINANGVVPVQDGVTSSPMDTPIMFNAVGACAPGGNTIQVDGITGLVNGMYVSMACDNQWGADLGVHNCNISGIDTGSKTLTFTPALPTGARTFKSIASGYKMAAIPAASAWPSWALNPETQFP